ncbi:MAG: hypothetical protein NZ701_07705, partial [Roseiflexus sp.]|nr:hypothetical protein [Roseiflexus sp.]
MSARTSLRLLFVFLVWLGTGVISPAIAYYAPSGVRGAVSDAPGMPGASAIPDIDWEPLVEPQSSGEQWTNLGSQPDGPLNNRVRAIGGSAGQVYVGGEFTDAGGNPNADYI